MMDPNPKSAKFKIAFTGTNCSGKTTMAMDVCARLKYQHQLAELVSSQDRKITWKDDHFPVDPRAHFGMISNLVNAEVQAELKGDAHVVITDRSVLDLYAIACTDHGDHPMVIGMEGYILAWMKTYTKVYYLSPLPYQEDGKRPADDFRMKTHATLIALADKYQLPNFVKIDRQEVYKDIQNLLGISAIKPIYAETAKWQAIADRLHRFIMIKDEQRSPVSSDVDAWVFLPAAAGFDDVTRANLYAREYFGDQVNVKFMLAPEQALRDPAYKPTFKHTIYKPNFG